MRTTTFSLLLTALAINAAPRLLPFQGHLTDSSGSAIQDGATVVQFKIYDAPVSGTAVWAGEVHKLSVNGGLVNTILGTKTSLTNVDFADPLYLEITVDAQATETSGHGQITAADPPLLPRQVLLPAVFAQESENSRKLDGHDWSSLLTTGDPTSGKLKPSVFSDGVIPAASIVANNQITNAQLSDGSVGSGEIIDKSITLADLADELRRELNPPGTVMAYAGTSPPPGWLMCDGDIVTQAEYPYLWDAIGFSHGAGTAADGDFHLPDYRGRFLRGTDDPDGPDSPTYAAGGNDPDAEDTERSIMNTGGNTGNRVGSLQADEFKRHRHSVSRKANLGDGWVNSSYPSGGELSTFNTNNPVAYTEFEGGDETRPKNANVNFIIKY